MAFITRDLVPFGGTLKQIMDPFTQYADEDLWTDLQGVQLNTLVENLPGKLEFKLKVWKKTSALVRGIRCAWLVHWSRRARSSSWMKPPLMWSDTRSNSACTDHCPSTQHLPVLDYDKVLVFRDGQMVEPDNSEELIRKYFLLEW